MREIAWALLGVLLMAAGFWLIVTTEPVSWLRQLAVALMILGSLGLFPGFYRLGK